VSKVAWRWTRRTVVVVDMEDEAERRVTNSISWPLLGLAVRIVTASHASKHIVPSSRCIAAQKSDVA
jgi:hypothetical protein